MTNPDTTVLDNSLLPTPGATERKKTPATPIKIARPRKLLNTQELTTEETHLLTKYPHIKPDTLANATKGEPIPGFTSEEVLKYNHKRSCTIICQTNNCSMTRRIATSDLAQVKLCEECTKNARNARKRERRAQAKTKK